MKKVLIVALCFAALVASVVFAHSGGTDKYGGHNNRKSGGYPFHNSGSLHHAENPYQDHTKCGICLSSKPKSEGDDRLIKDAEVVRTLQAGLNCLGDKVTIDGKMSQETIAAVREYIDSKN